MSEHNSIISTLSTRCKHHGPFTKVEAAAHVAELKVKMKYLDLENKKKLELEKLNAQKELDIALARRNAFETEEDNGKTILYGKDDGVKDIDIGLSKPKRVEEYVQEYIENNPLVNTDRATCQASVSEDILQLKQPSGQQPLLASTPYSQLNASSPDFVPRGNHIKDTIGMSEYSRDLANLTRSLTDQINIGRLPTPEPGVFSGDPLHYPSWKGAFETLIERRGILAEERIYYLRRYLSGAAKESVEGLLLLNTSQAYDRAKTVLDKRFGNPFIVADAFHDKLESWPKIDGRDGQALRKLADYLGQCFVSMQTIDSLSIWNDERENRKILAKLTEWLTYRWSRIVKQWREEKCSFPPFEHFVEFISKESDIMCDPVTLFRLSKPGKRHESEQSKPSAKRSTFSTGSFVAQEICAYCEKRGHNIDICRSFLAKTLAERKDIVRERNLCFGCLKTGHKSKYCPKRIKCKTCSGYHPTALHGDTVKGRDSSTPAEKNNSMNEVSSNTTIPKPTVAHVNDALNNEQIDKCSMIIPVWLSHKDNPQYERLVYALLDTQSDTTFALESTCDALDVSGPHVKLMLSTMISEEQLVDSYKICGLSVRGFGRNVQIPLPVTYTREIMPANRNHIPTPEKVKMWPHLEHLASELMPLSEVEVGLLIGYNCPRALIPRNVIPPANDNEPYGQETVLGWGVVGIIDHNQIDTADMIGMSHRVITCTVPQNLQVQSRPTCYNKVCVSLRTAVKEVVSPHDVAKLMELDFHEHKTSGVPISYEDKQFLSQVENGILTNPVHGS